MLQRAEKSRLKTFGPSFLGSPDFPPALIAAINESDPAGVFLPAHLKAPAKPSSSDIEKSAHETNIRAWTLQGKKILNLSGGADKLVPYSCSKVFLDFLKSASGPRGVWKDADISLEDRIFEGVGHEATPAMLEAAVGFIGDTLVAGEEGGKGGGRSRI